VTPGVFQRRADLITSAPPANSQDAGEAHRVDCHLDQMLAARGMTLAELASRAGVTAVRAHLLRQLGRAAEARQAYDVALALTTNPAERRFLQSRRAALP
jgi:hypothetical protein